MSLRPVTLTLALLALTAVGCGGDDDDSSSAAPAEPGAESNEQFDADGIDLTFEYPEDLQARDEIEFSRSAGSAATATGGVGIDEANVIAVQRFDLETEVTKGNLNRVKREADTLFSQLAGDRADGERTTIAGLPALEYEIDLEEPADASTRAIAIFDGDVEYLMNCQSTPDRAEQIAAACDLALETLELE
jgi:hypothetical protein